MTTFDNSTRSTHDLYHTLWSKAVGTPDYKKDEWRELGNRLHPSDKCLPFVEQPLTVKLLLIFGCAFLLLGLVGTIFILVKSV